MIWNWNEGSDDIYFEFAIKIQNVKLIDLILNTLVSG